MCDNVYTSSQYKATWHMTSYRALAVVEWIVLASKSEEATAAAGSSFPCLLVEPLNNGHLGTNHFVCRREVVLSVANIYATIYTLVGASESVLYTEMSFIQSVLVPYCACTCTCMCTLHGHVHIIGVYMHVQQTKEHTRSTLHYIPYT